MNPRLPPLDAAGSGSSAGGNAANAAAAVVTAAATDAKAAADAADRAASDAARAADAALVAAGPSVTPVNAAAAVSAATGAAADARQAARSAAMAARDASKAAADAEAANSAADQDAKPEVAAAHAAEAAENSANTAAAAARAADNAAFSAAQAASKANITRAQAPADFTVMPATISACDPSGSFVIAGDHLARTPERYLLGTVPAFSFGGKGGGDAPGSDAAQSIEVDFKGLQSSNRGLAEITLSMAATDGALRQQRIGVEGSTAACTAAKSPFTPTSDGAPSGKGLAITFASPGKQPVDESDLCTLPLTLIATGTDAPKLAAASTSILGEAYAGNVQHASSGKMTSTTVTFAKLPNFKDSMPSSHQMRIDVVLTGKKTGAITIPVTCGS